jgi:CrcB protein
VIALGVLIGGGLGALARYLLEGVVAPRQRSPFPLSTLVVNVTGSAALGLIVGLASRGTLSSQWTTWVGTGLVGGYTTFSTFTYETVRLIESGAWTYAAWNVALSGPLSFGVAAVAYLLSRGR